MSKTLHLTLHKPAFDVMVTGEKSLEFREDTNWIRSRLFDQDGEKIRYDLVKFTNGYGKDRPYFICRLHGFWLETLYCKLTYSNGLTIAPGTYFILVLGPITETGNLNQ